MGSGSWSTSSFRSYATSMGRSVSADGTSSGQNMFTKRCIDPSLDPKNVVRECCDSAEHPNTIPVILALDVTGSMGAACRKTATCINKIMTDLYGKYADIEFLIMGIGDLAYDIAPIQASQFESDIRIAEALDKVFMEMGGGGNGYESYTAAWYFGVRHTRLDCHKRGKKGIIITMGDEPLNPYLPKCELASVTGDGLEADIETPALYAETAEKFDVFHIAIDDTDSSYQRYKHEVDNTWGQFLGKRYLISSIDSLPDTVTKCIDMALGEADNVKPDDSGQVQMTSNGNISW